MQALVNIIRELPRYLWSGWGAVSAIFLFIALWELGYQQWGDLVLPAPLATFKQVFILLETQNLAEHLQITFYRGGIGILLAAVLGTVLGLIAGNFATAAVISRPIITILTGIPPIAWIVMAMIWFGLSDTTAIFTVTVACFPIVFVGALQGTVTLENQLKVMAESFGTPRWMRFVDVDFPHLFSYLFPSWVSAIGMGWKIVVMSELMSTSDGLGAMLAVSRSMLDTTSALAIVMVLVGILLSVEYLLLYPIRQEVEKWRD